MSQLWPFSSGLVGNTLQTATGKPFLIVAAKGWYLTIRIASSGKERRVLREEIEATATLWDDAAPAPSNDTIRNSKSSETNAP
jgi:hypothetical protein